MGDPTTSAAAGYFSFQIMIDQAKELLEKNAPRMTYGGSALTAGSSYASQNSQATPFVISLEEFGIITGIIGVICGLALQAYFGWQKLKLQKAAYAQLGAKADEVDSEKANL
jgi:hypothetical protein